MSKCDAANDLPANSIITTTESATARSHFRIYSINKSLLRHPARKRSGSILATREPAWGTRALKHGPLQQEYDQRQRYTAGRLQLMDSKENDGMTMRAAKRIMAIVQA